MMMRVKTRKKVAMVRSKKTEKARIKKPKIGKKKSQSGKRVI